MDFSSRKPWRAVAFCNKGKLELMSRNHKSFNEKFYSVYNSLKALGLQAVLDGEVAVLNSKGATSFGALQNWRSEADGDLVYYVFDIGSNNGFVIVSAEDVGYPIIGYSNTGEYVVPQKGNEIDFWIPSNTSPPMVPILVYHSSPNTSSPK